MIKNPKIGDKVWFIDTDLEYNIITKSGIISAVFIETPAVEIDYWHSRSFEQIWKNSKIPESAFENEIHQLLKDLENDKSKIDNNIKNLTEQLRGRCLSSESNSKKNSKIS